MLNPQPRLSLEIPHGSSSRSLSFRRLRRPTPLPTLHRPFEDESLIERLISVFSTRRR